MEHLSQGNGFVNTEAAGNFTMVPNSILRNSGISLQAKALFAIIRSKPPEFEFCGRRLARESGNGFDSHNRAIRELEDKGFLERKRLPTGRTTWTLKDSSSENQNGAKPDSENQNEEPDSENPKLGKPQVGKTRTVSNTEAKVKRTKSNTEPPKSPFPRNSENTNQVSLFPRAETARRHKGRKAQRVDVNDPSMLALGRIFSKRSGHLWREEDIQRFRDADPSEDEVGLVVEFYQAELREDSDLRFRRKSLETLLNNWTSEIGKAEEFANNPERHRKPQSVRKSQW